MQSVNSIFVLLLIPIFEKGVYPLTKYLRIPQSPLQRMGAGMVFCAAAFFISFVVQQQINLAYTVPTAASFNQTSVRAINIAGSNATLDFGDSITTQHLTANQSIGYVSIPDGLTTIDVSVYGGGSYSSSIFFSEGTVNTIVLKDADLYNFTDLFDVSIESQPSYARVRFIQLNGVLPTITLTSDADPDFDLSGLTPMTASTYDAGLIVSGSNSITASSALGTPLFVFNINVIPGAYYTCVVFENNQARRPLGHVDVYL